MVSLNAWNVDNKKLYIINHLCLVNLNLGNLNFYILYLRLLFVCLVSFVSMHYLWLCCSVLFLKRNLSCVLSVEALIVSAQRQTTEIRSTVGNKQGCIWLLLVFILALIISVSSTEREPYLARQPVASQVYWFPLIHVDILSSTAGFGILPESLESVHCGHRGEP